MAEGEATRSPAATDPCLRSYRVRTRKRESTSPCALSSTHGKEDEAE